MMMARAEPERRQLEDDVGPFRLDAVGHASDQDRVGQHGEVVAMLLDGSDGEKENAFVARGLAQLGEGHLCEFHGVYLTPRPPSPKRQRGVTRAQLSTRDEPLPRWLRESSP